MTTSSQKTAIIAASVLSVLAFFQLVVIVIVLVRHPNGTPAAAHFNVTPAPATTSKNNAAASPTTGSDRPDNTATPVGSSEAIPEAAVAPSEVDILVKRATDIRARGDMSGTLASLRDAQKLYPDNPKIVAEFATTYEQMGLVDKALAQWKRVADFGEKAGDLYGTAAEKVHAGLTPKEPLSGRDEEGLQPGSTLGFTDVQKNYDSSGDAEKVSLRMGIKARSGTAITASDVNIQAMFYDLVDNKDVQPTDPHSTRVTSEWLTVPADWKEDGVEVLKVRYEQKSPATGEKPAVERKYLGYIIRVYYENELQDVMADPVRLLQNFPPPVSLQKEIPQ